MQEDKSEGGTGGVCIVWGAGGEEFNGDLNRTLNIFAGFISNT